VSLTFAMYRTLHENHTLSQKGTKSSALFMYPYKGYKLALNLSLLDLLCLFMFALNKPLILATKLFLMLMLQLFCQQNVT
jgi:hypothetical protein